MRLTYTALLCLALYSPLRAMASSWDPPDSALIINANTVGGVAQKSGTSATVQGSVTGYKVGLNVGVFVPGHSIDVPSALTLQKAKLRFFFPDATHEVTQDVATIVNKNGSISFTYQTPPLEAGAPNTFEALATAWPDDLLKIEQTKAKLDARLSYVNYILHRTQSTSLPSKDLRYLLDLRALLQKVTSELTKTLHARQETIGELRLPLQVDNFVSGPALYSTLAKNMRLSVAPSIGSAIQGETTPVTFTVTNIRQNGDPLNVADDGQEWLIDYAFNGSSIGRSGPQPVPHGSSVVYTFTTPKLSPSASNLLQISVYAAKKGISGITGNLLGKELGTITAVVPVAPDVVRPVWQSGYTPAASQPFVQKMPPVNANVNDPFGLIDASAFNAMLDGMQDGNLTTELPILPTSVSGIQAVLTLILSGGEQVDTDVTGKLTFGSPDQGQTFAVSGDLNPLPDGLYRFSLHAQDLAGNSADPDPVSTVFVIDTTPPLLSGLTPSDQEEKLNIFVVSGQANEPLRSVTVDGVPLVLSPDGRHFSGQYTAQIPGDVELHWVATDLAGNVATDDTVAYLPDALFDDLHASIPPATGLVEVKVSTVGSLPSAATVVLDFQGILLTDEHGNLVAADTTGVNGGGFPRKYDSRCWS